MKESHAPEPEFDRLESPQLVVRRFAESDLADFIAYRRDPAVTRFQSWQTFDEDETRTFIHKMSVAPVGEPGQWFQFAVEHRRDSCLIGDMGLHVSTDDQRQAELGYTLAPAHQGRGLGCEMVARLLDFVFDTLNLHRIYAHILTDNHASIALAERLNFRREAHFVQAYWFNERWRDEYLYALLARDWQAQPKQTNNPTTT